MTDLAPFNDAAVCPKCGGADIHTRHIRKGGRDHLWRPRCGLWSMSDPEHLDRHCRRCGYEWAEAPMDSVAPAAPLPRAGGERYNKGKARADRIRV